MWKYKDKIKNLPRVTLEVISEVCLGMLPSEYRSHPWDLPYADKNFAKIFDQEDQLNGYAAAYTNWHKGKLRIAFDNTPTDTFVGEIAVIAWLQYSFMSISKRKVITVESKKLYSLSLRK